MGAYPSKTGGVKAMSAFDPDVHTADTFVGGSGGIAAVPSTAFDASPVPISFMALTRNV